MEIGPRVDDRTHESDESTSHASETVLAVVVSFLNEKDYLPTLLDSIDAQTRLPDQLVLVDDGSIDGSYELAVAFAVARPYVLTVRRPPRPLETDRLAGAAELLAFQWGLTRVTVPYDIVVKLDADLKLSPYHFAEVESMFVADPGLGVAGAHLSVVGPGSTIVRERQPEDHVRGPNKFYRRRCLEEISPVPSHLGWDTIDEVKARMRGWTTRVVALPGGDSIHLRPVGTHDGRLRAYWRWGECAHGYGSHPVTVAASALVRASRRPYGICGAAYVLGWLNAGIRHRPRADAEIRAFRRHEEMTRLRRLVADQLRRRVHACGSGSHELGDRPLR